MTTERETMQAALLRAAGVFGGMRLMFDRTDNRYDDCLALAAEMRQAATVPSVPMDDAQADALIVVMAGANEYDPYKD